MSNFALPHLSRRQALFGGALDAGGLLLPAQAAPSCLVMPQSVEGPYYFDAKMTRADVTEGKPGIPLGLNLTVLGADCRPIPSARVDLWHCDAGGLYSGYRQPGEDGEIDLRRQFFLRGTQFTDAAGGVAFRTLYPGWYRGRTTHLHYKVFLDTKTVLNGQVFLPDALSEFIYANVPAYQRGEARDTLNRTDGIAAQAGDAAHAAIREEGQRYVATMTVGVDPAAIVEADPRRPPMGLEGPPPPPPPGGGPGGPPPEGGGPPRPPALSAEERLKLLVPGA